MTDLPKINRMFKTKSKTSTMLPSLAHLSLAHLSISACYDENDDELDMNDVAEQAVTVYNRYKYSRGDERERAYDAAASMVAILSELLLKKSKWSETDIDNMVERDVQNILFRILQSISQVRTNLISVKWFNASSNFLEYFNKGFLLRQVGDFARPAKNQKCEACGKEDLEDPYCVEIAGCDTESEKLGRDVLMDFVPEGWNANLLVTKPRDYASSFKRLVHYYNNFTSRSPWKRRFIIGSTCHKYCMHKWTARTTVLEAMWDASSLIDDDNDEVCIDAMLDQSWVETLSSRLNVLNKVLQVGDDGRQIVKIPTLDPPVDTAKWRELDRLND